MRNGRKRKSTINKKLISEHTRRFRVGIRVDFINGGRYLWDCPPIFMRSLVRLGGLPRTQSNNSYYKGKRNYTPRMHPEVLDNRINSGLAAAASYATELLQRLPLSKRMMRAQKAPA